MTWSRATYTCTCTWRTFSECVIIEIYELRRIAYEVLDCPCKVLVSHAIVVTALLFFLHCRVWATVREWAVLQLCYWCTLMKRWVPGSCDSQAVSCDPHAVLWNSCTISCDPLQCHVILIQCHDSHHVMWTLHNIMWSSIVSCDPHAVSCDPHAVSCDSHTMSCDPDLESCGKEECFLP